MALGVTFSIQPFASAEANDSILARQRKRSGLRPRLEMFSFTPLLCGTTPPSLIRMTDRRAGEKERGRDRDEEPSERKRGGEWALETYKWYTGQRKMLSFFSAALMSSNTHILLT